MPGPLPKPATQRRRTNKPAIPTTNLPAEGRKGPIPRIPKWTKLGETGKTWWRWAWRTPQAAAWGSGHESVVARRAALEDDLAAIDRVGSLDALDLLETEAEAFKLLIGRLASLATGRLQIVKEMRELDDRLGLTPKAMAALRWTITETPTTETNGSVTAIDDYRAVVGA